MSKGFGKASIYDALREARSQDFWSQTAENHRTFQMDVPLVFTQDESGSVSFGINFAT
jgi:hypothetical protein